MSSNMRKLMALSCKRFFFVMTLHDDEVADMDKFCSRKATWTSSSTRTKPD